MSRIIELTYQAGEATLRWLCDYHDYEVVGFENLPQYGPALVAFHHSLATYDSFLLGIPIIDRLGRQFRGLADNLIFRTPGLGHLFSSMGFVPGTREATVAMLREDSIIGLAPGGMREGLRSSGQRYQFDWTGRYGFVWTSMLAGAPIVLGACPAGDHIYDVYDNPLTPWLYRRFHFPVPFFRGRSNTPLPRPVKLWHLLSEPIYPDVAPDQVTRADVQRHHQRLCERMTQLMQDSLALAPSFGVEPGDLVVEKP
ncbi:MAG: lysophospholipid acyltransferase family protein [Myxococcota bacterium]